MVHAHSGLRYIVLISLVLALIMAVSALLGNKQWTEKIRKVAMIGFISTHIQLLLGIVLMFTSGKVSFENMMATDLYRFFTMEHPVQMVLAIALITIGYMKAKRVDGDVKKLKTLAISYGVGLLVILIAIPWPFREALGSSWF